MKKANLGGDPINDPTGRKSGVTQDPAVPSSPVERFSWRTFDPLTLPDGVDSPLATELVTFRDRLDELLADHGGEFVNIKGDRIVGLHPNRPAAVKAVFQEFGRELALVQQVVEFEPVRHFQST